VIDKSLVASEFLFASPLDRCRYIGTPVRDRPQWLKKNVGRWQRIQDVLQEPAPLRPRAEGESNVEAIPAGPRSPTPPCDVRNNGDDADDAGLADIPADDRPSPAMVPQVVDGPPLASLTASEITIGTRRYVSAQGAASILKVSVRTLSRLHAAGKGPPRRSAGRSCTISASFRNGSKADKS
jgi:hypothetical protein